MEGQALLICRYGCTNAPVRIHDKMSYDDVVQKICEKLSDLTPNSISLTYSVTSYSNCIIENNNDLENLFFLLSGGDRGRVVRVQVELRNTPTAEDAWSGSPSAIYDSSESDMDDDVDDDEEDLLPTFYA